MTQKKPAEKDACPVNYAEYGIIRDIVFGTVKMVLVGFVAALIYLVWRVSQ